MNSPHDRYARQERFAPIGPSGQQRLARSQVAIVGCGALGSVAAEILARAGVGRLRLIDRDTVEWSNLQRQALYDEADVQQGRAKADAAARHLQRINSEIVAEPVVTDVTADQIDAVLADVDLVLDGTDNFEIRLLINDWALERGVPWVHGGAVGGAGQVFLFRPGVTACFRCLVPQVPAAGSFDTCDTAGVVGAVTHLVASLQALEAIKYLSGNLAAVNDSVWTLDGWAGRMRAIDPSGLRRQDCPACAGGERIYLQQRGQGGKPAVLCGRNTVQLPSPVGSAPPDLQALARRLRVLGPVQHNRFLVRVQLEGTRSVTLFGDGRVLVGGTEDPAEARRIYAAVVGG